MDQAEADLAGFLARFSEEVALRGAAIIARLRQKYPSANLLVYDNYNALAIGFSAGEKLSGTFLSVAVYPRWVSLFLSARLDDPASLLKGSGGSVRHIVLEDAAALDGSGVAALLNQAIERAQPPLDPAHQGQLIVKSISAKQRPRRP
jgi:hypothetical protein